MAIFCKRPVRVEAWPVSELLSAIVDGWENMPPQITAAYERGEVLFLGHPSRVEIRTLEGWMIGNADDWIIYGVKCELYPCKPDIFSATYDAVISPI